ATRPAGWTTSTGSTWRVARSRRTAGSVPLAVMADSKPAAYETTAVGAFAGSATSVRPHTKLIGLLALGHFVIDVTQGSLPAGLPFLKQLHGWSSARVATIVLPANLTSSIIQPLFGYLSDQIARRWILPLSVFVAGTGIALVGLTPGYGAGVALVVVMGLGVAAWHPRATRRPPSSPATARRPRCPGSRWGATSASPS